MANRYTVRVTAFGEIIYEGVEKLAPPPPPAAMQGHWVEPRSGLRLHIAADGVIAFDNGKTKCIGNFFNHRTEVKMQDGFLVVLAIGKSESFWFGPFKNPYYCRTGTEELRLLAWLKERGLCNETKRENNES